MSDQCNREKHLLYLDKSTPDEFINAELMDWIYLIGDISTPYELNFVRQFGHALKVRDNQMREQGAKAERERVLDVLYVYFTKWGTMGGECHFDMNSDRCLSYTDCQVCMLDHAVESLRTNPADSGGEAGAKGGRRE